MSIQGDQVIYDYLSRVGDLAHGKLAPPHRARMVAELRAKIETERAQTGAQDPDQVRDLLQRMGDPEAIVADEIRRAPDHLARRTGRALPAGTSPPVPGVNGPAAGTDGTEATRQIARPGAGPGSGAVGPGQPWWRAVEEEDAAEPGAPPAAQSPPGQYPSGQTHRSRPVSTPGRGDGVADWCHPIRAVARAAGRWARLPARPPIRVPPSRWYGCPPVEPNGSTGSAGSGEAGSPVTALAGAFRGRNRRELLAIVLLLIGGVVPSVLALVLGYVVVLSSRVWREGDKRFAVFAVPLISAVSLALMMWLQAKGQTGGGPPSGSELGKQAAHYVSTLTRIVGLVSAVFLGWRLSREIRGSRLSGFHTAVGDRRNALESDGTHVLPDAGRLPRVARRAPRHRERTAGRLLQEGLRQAEHHLARVGGRGALLRLDRRRAAQPRRARATPSASRRGKPRSIWSAVNIARVRGADRAGPHAPGRAWRPSRPAPTERSGDLLLRAAPRRRRLDEAQERQFRANAKAWEYFQARPPWYRRTATWWVISAKKEETRQRRLATLIEDSEQGRLIGPLTRPSPRQQ